MADLAGILADLEAESAELDELVAHLDAAGWATPTPAPGWTIAHQLGHLAWTDDLALRAVTDPAAVRDSLARVAGDPYSFVDAAAEAARGAAAAAAAGRVARGPGRPGRRAGRRPVGPEDRLVRAADERRLDGNRPADGDLGARPGRGGRARGAPDADGPAAARRPPRRAHPRLRLPGAWPDAAGRAVPCGTDRAGRQPAGSGAPPRLRSGSPARPSTSACSSPSAATATTSPCARRARTADEWLEIAQAFAGPPGDGRKPGQFR